MGHETGNTLQCGASGLGLAAPNQSAAVLLLLRRPGRVSSTSRASHTASTLASWRLGVSVSASVSVSVHVCVQVVPEDAAVFSVSAVVP